MFRVLQPDEIDCRVAQVKENGVSLLLYKTARVDANLLDETVGNENWECDFKVINDNLYGGIGIKFGDEWVWKWDCGTESNTEKEKGEASDSFKRAGVKWGIGRELYSAPFIWIGADKCRINGNRCMDKFHVEAIKYDDKRNIEALSIKNQDGKRVYLMNKTFSSENQEKKK